MYFPLVNVTHYSLQLGLSKPDELVAKCKEKGYQACGITDRMSISGCVAHSKACKRAGIKPILGCWFDDGTIVIAKNLKGWHDLIEMVSSKQRSVSGDTIQFAYNLNSDPSSIPMSYYVNKEDAEIHKVHLCSGEKTTLKGWKNAKDTSVLKMFMGTDQWYVREPQLSDAVDQGFFQEIYDDVEDFDILNDYMLPHFPLPEGETSEEDYLTKLARKGWREHLIENGKVEDEEAKQAYLERYKEEFEVFKKGDLFGYFLIVQDIIQYCKSNGWYTGPGRGSAAGCLISYLLGITEIDPLEYDLLFERFYNADRTDSLPDIDMDVPAGKRDAIIDYLRDRYGSDHVAQMVTFGGLKGRSAMKEVLRVHQACNGAEQNRITRSIPDEARISDQLELMDADERSIIRWALINNPDDLVDYCTIDEDGNLHGPFAQYFEQAIKLEGTFKNYGKHAAGVVISKEPLHTVCPMTDQKHSDEPIAALEMNDLEALGHVKFDVLGLTLLDKLMAIDADEGPDE